MHYFLTVFFFFNRNTLILEEVKGILQIPSFLSLWIESWPFYCRDCTLFLRGSHDMWHHYTSMSTVRFPTSWAHGVSMKPSNMSAFQPRLELVFQLVTYKEMAGSKGSLSLPQSDVCSTGKDGRYKQRCSWGAKGEWCCHPDWQTPKGQQNEHDINEKKKIIFCTQ